MKNLSVVAALALAGAALAQNPALADNRDFKLSNSTPWTVERVYVTHVNAETWGNDVLGNKTLVAGNSVNVYWPSSRNVYGDACAYDVLVKFSGNVEMRWNRINTCSIRQMNVWYDFQSRTYQASWN